MSCQNTPWLTEVITSLEYEALQETSLEFKDANKQKINEWRKKGRLWTSKYIFILLCLVRNRLSGTGGNRPFGWFGFVMKSAETSLSVVALKYSCQEVCVIIILVLLHPTYEEPKKKNKDCEFYGRNKGKHSGQVHQWHC